MMFSNNSSVPFRFLICFRFSLSVPFRFPFCSDLVLEYTMADVHVNVNSFEFFQSNHLATMKCEEALKTAGLDFKKLTDDKFGCSHLSPLDLTYYDGYPLPDKGSIHPQFRKWITAHKVKLTCGMYHLVLPNPLKDRPSYVHKWCYACGWDVYHYTELWLQNLNDEETDHSDRYLISSDLGAASHVEDTKPPALVTVPDTPAVIAITASTTEVVYHAHLSSEDNEDNKPAGVDVTFTQNSDATAVNHEHNSKSGDSVYSTETAAENDANRKRWLNNNPPEDSIQDFTSSEDDTMTLPHCYAHYNLDTQRAKANMEQSVIDARKTKKARVSISPVVNTVTGEPTEDPRTTSSTGGYY